MTPGMIPRELIDEILDRTDIVQLIESYLPLKRQGRNMVGLCPFHLEDTPSFSVSPDKQMFYCFGCQKGGNAISFIMEYEHLSFQEAMVKLAQKAGVTLPEREMTSQQKRAYDETRRLLQINKATAAYYREQLKRTSFALAYLQKRDISEEIASRFQLGYAADSWENLKQFLLKKGFTEPEMLKAGVVSRGESGKYFDRFRNRLMFPICDKKGDVIAFGGRVLDDSLPKYLNTPETSVFHKGQNLYGLHLAFPNIRKEEEAILMEGNVDVITAHQCGVDNAVAPLGTAFTEEHAKILMRYCTRVTVAFDGDGAGQRATDKTLDILMRHGFRVYAMEIPSPHDPDDYLRTYGKIGWDRLKANSLSYMDFKIKTAMTKFDVATAEGKADILKELGPSLFALKNIVEQSEYIREISEKLDISEDVMRMDMQRKAAVGRRDIGSGIDFNEEKVAKGITTAKNSVLYFAAENQSVFEEIDAATGWSFLDRADQKTVVKIIKEHLLTYTWRFRDLIDLATEEEKSTIVSYIMDDPFALVKDKNEMFRDCWRGIRKDALMKEKDQIQRRIKECEKSGNNGEVDILLRNFAKIQQELRKL